MESDPQGEPTDKWVKEVGESECWTVMDQIRVQTLPGTKVRRLPASVESRKAYESIWGMAAERLLPYPAAPQFHFSNLGREDFFEAGEE